MAAAMNPTRKRIAMLIVAVGGALIVERVVALSAGEGADAGDARPAVAERRFSRGSGAPQAENPVATGELRLDRLARRLQGPDASAGVASAPRAALFDVVSWQPPAPKVAAPPMPKPVAPPFPYPYMGGLSEDGVRTTFFMKGGRVLPVKAGDVVDAAYRVDEMTDQQMTLTYLPLNETLSVALEAGR